LQPRVQRNAVCAVVHLAMTVRTDSADPSRMIGPSIGDAARVVGLQVRTAIQSREWSGTTAGLACPVCAAKYVFANRETTFVEDPLRVALDLFRGLRRRAIGSLSKISNRDTPRWPFRLLNRCWLVRVRRDEMEDDRLAHLAGSILRVAILPR